LPGQIPYRPGPDRSAAALGFEPAQVCVARGDTLGVGAVWSADGEGVDVG
jgi:hypothetical protein